MSSNILLLGLGNILLQDEGLGVYALEQLQARYHLPANVRALDGGTMGLDLLPYLGQATHLLILDAVQIGQPPGTLVRLEGAEIPAALSLKMSMHQVGLQELLALGDLVGTLPPRVVVWGIQPAWLDWGLELSPPVLNRLDNLIESAVLELCGWSALVESQSQQLMKEDIMSSR